MRAVLAGAAWIALLASQAMLTAAESSSLGTRSPVGPAKGNLVIVGGGSMAGLWPVFLELAGGKDASIVVIPTANERVEAEDRTVGLLRTLGVKEVVQLHTRDRAVADTEEFSAPLKTARGAWLTGGRQWRLADAYLNTRTLREIVALLERGGVVGGSSAGATIQGSYLVRGAPEGNTIMMSPGHEEGFGFLRASAIDQHVNTRRRADDLRPVLQKHRELLGIALDEATALIVRGDECRIVGVGRARFFASPDEVAVELTDGARYDLASRRMLSN